MSLNDVILVACDRRCKRLKYYVIPNICADDDWSTAVRRLIDRGNMKWTFLRSKALCIGHDIQKKIDTEYGVRELDIN